LQHVKIVSVLACRESRNIFHPVTFTHPGVSFNCANVSFKPADVSFECVGVSFKCAETNFHTPVS